MDADVFTGGRRASPCRPLLPFLLLLLLVAMPVRADDIALVRLQEIASAGAPGLALELLDADQPDAADDPERWVEWERVRIDILADAGDWQRAVERLQELPPAAPEPFRRWALEHRASFRLELGESDTARALLRELIWTAGPGASSEELQRWRQLVIRSYLVDGRTDDAVTALRRFEQDHADPPSGWSLLRTRVLLHAGRAGEALRRLPAEPEGELQALGLLARLRAGNDEAGRIRSRAVELMEEADLPPVQRARLWFVAAEAAAMQPEPGWRALALERAAALAERLPDTETLFAVGGDALWTAWLDYGLQSGNQRQLLIGDDGGWFEAAEDSLPQYPVRARSFLAVVAQRGNPDNRARAHARLIEQLGEDGPGMATARHAYLRAERYEEVESIPENVRYRLVDDALERNNVSEATRLLATLTESPSGVDQFSWQLLRARVLVLGGRIEDGVAALHRLLDEHADLDKERLDRFLQVVFDLQGAEKHDEALELLQRIGRRELPSQRRRELLYWQAESREAQERYLEAAQLFMDSATLTDPRGGDPWGQTAMYQAAGALTEIGLIGDARRIYRRLLRVTEDSSRRSQLRNRLQQLRLREGGPDDVPAPEEDEP